MLRGRFGAQVDLIFGEEKDLIADRHLRQDVAFLGGGGTAEARHRVGRIRGSPMLRQSQVGELVIAPLVLYCERLIPRVSDGGGVGGSFGVGAGGSFGVGFGFGGVTGCDISSTNSSRIS